MRPPRSLVAIFLCYAIAALGADLRGASAPIPELEPHWRFVELPNFDILSSCGDERTQYYIECMYRALPLMELPSEFTRASQRIQIILCDHPLDPAFVPDDAPAALRQFDGSSTVSYAKGDDGETMFIRVSLRRWRGKNSGWDVVGLPLHLVPFLVEHHSPQPPKWLRTAVDKIYDNDETTYVAGSTLRWPGVPEIRRQLKDAVGKPQNLRPLSELLGEAQPPSDPADLARWSAEAALFMHTVLYGNPGHPEKFWEFCERACREPITERMFRDCFNMRFSAMREAMSRHLADGLEKRTRLYGAPLSGKPNIALRDATVSEICRMEGEWELIYAEQLKDSYPQLSGTFLARAGATLHHAHAAGERDGRLLAALGLYYRAAGETEKAGEFLGLSMSAPQVRPRAPRELAQIRLDAAKATPLGTSGKLSREQTAGVLVPLAVARARQPPVLATYELLVDTWEASEEAPTREDFLALREVLKYFPRERPLVTRAAELAQRVKFDDEAAFLRHAHDQFAAAAGDSR